MVKAVFDLGANRFLRFLVAGSVNTLFGFVVYVICITIGMPTWLALMAGMTLGTAFNFLTTGGYVFRRLSKAIIPRFIVFNILVYCINLVSIEFVSIWINSKIVSQATIVIPMAVVSYFLLARFVFCQDSA